jgi:hypothetical protein
MVTAFTGWIDAGEATADAMRFLVRQLAAEPLAAIDLEDFVDFTQIRPVVRLSAEGERTIRWPRSAFWLWQPPAPRANLAKTSFPPVRKYPTVFHSEGVTFHIQRWGFLHIMWRSRLAVHGKPSKVNFAENER